MEEDTDRPVRDGFGGKEEALDWKGHGMEIPCKVHLGIQSRHWGNPGRRGGQRDACVVRGEWGKMKRCLPA